jgi:hypothetical protein
MFISYKPDLCLPVTSAGHSFFSGGRKVDECNGISSIYLNHGAFCGHFLGKPHGMME